MIELHVIGAGPAYSNLPGALGSAYLVRSSQHGLVLDFGQGIFPSLAAAFEPSDLSAVLISHLHPDHFIDLIALRHYLRRAELRRTPPLRLIAPRGIGERLDGAYGQPGFAVEAFAIEPLQPGLLSSNGFEIEICRVRHSGESYAFRVARAGEDAGVVYSGDCAAAADLLPLIRPGDLLLSEATFGPGPVPSGMPHLDGPAVGRLAEESGASHVVVTHIRLGCDLGATLASVRAAYHGAVSLARPGFRAIV
jgi:ribonuclease BN (tRNA processing enzyme)